MTGLGGRRSPLPGCVDSEPRGHWAGQPVRPHWLSSEASSSQHSTTPGSGVPSPWLCLGNSALSPRPPLQWPRGAFRCADRAGDPGAGLGWRFRLRCGWCLGCVQCAPRSEGAELGGSLRGVRHCPERQSHCHLVHEDFAFVVLSLCPCHLHLWTLVPRPASLTSQGILGGEPVPGAGLLGLPVSCCPRPWLVLWLPCAVTKGLG